MQLPSPEKLLSLIKFLSEIEHRNTLILEFADPELIAYLLDNQIIQAWHDGTYVATIEGLEFIENIRQSLGDKPYKIGVNPLDKIVVWLTPPTGINFTDVVDDWKRKNEIA